MKYLKMLGLAAVAAMAVMAFLGAGTASATKLCKNNTETTDCLNHYPAGTTIHATQGTSTGSLETTGGTTLVTCAESTLKGKTTNTGSTTETVKGPIEILNFGICTNTVKTLVPGELEIHADTEGTKHTDNGTLTARNTQVTVNGIFGESCVYGAGAGIDIGTLVGGNPATITISALVPLISGGGLCPKETRWTTDYKVTTPTPLYVSEG